VRTSNCLLSRLHLQLKNLAPWLMLRAALVGIRIPLRAPVVAVSAFRCGRSFLTILRCARSILRWSERYLELVDHPVPQLLRTLPRQAIGRLSAAVRSDGGSATFGKVIFFTVPLALPDSSSLRYEKSSMMSSSAEEVLDSRLRAEA